MEKTLNMVSFGTTEVRTELYTFSVLINETSKFANGRKDTGTADTLRIY